MTTRNENAAYLADVTAYAAGDETRLASLRAFHARTRGQRYATQEIARLRGLSQEDKDIFARFVAAWFEMDGSR